MKSRARALFDRIEPIAMAMAFAFLFGATITAPAKACGWWGDGEMNKHWETPILGSDGKLVPEALDLQTAKLPGRMGYGIAVPQPGQAIPYLKATYGRPLNRIDELRAFGFGAVIDVGTPAKSAKLHRQETEAVGMRYFNIPVVGNTPSIKQSKLFSQKVMELQNGPLLVYAPTAPLLAMTWASHRINIGAPLEYAIMEGRALGLSDEQEAVLRKRAQTR